MDINAILISEADNVVTVITEIAIGGQVSYRCQNEIRSLTAQEAIPYCNKVALHDIAVGDKVIKYGEMIGKSTAAICKGCLVSHNNIYSVPRDYNSEIV